MISAIFLDSSRNGAPHIRPGSATLTGDGAPNLEGDDLGDIGEIMPDLKDGCIAYAALSGLVLDLLDDFKAEPVRSDDRNRALVQPDRAATALIMIADPATQPL